jgi:hypothetical protein
MTHAIETPIAAGELIDKITILEIKAERIADAARTENVRTELALLYQRRDSVLPMDLVLAALAGRLKGINERLWDLEDTVRDCERRQDFESSFVSAARAIYRTNDERAAVKRDINMVTGSILIEEKSYAKY